MNEPIKKYALFFRNKRAEFINNTMFSDSDGPPSWTLYNDTLHDTWDHAVMDEYHMRRRDGHQTTITEVIISRPDDILKEKTHDPA